MEKFKEDIITQKEALQVIRPGEDHTFELDEDILTEILLKDEIKDRYVCVVSVAGAFRKGKSFLLNFFLRYMYSVYGQNKSTNWLGDEDKPLSGFSWRGGSERHTTGILMWPEIFLHDLPNGEKIAIILLDTQGTFDSESTMKECTTVFALSTLLSSVQIFNVSQNIQEDDLQHLQLFTEYGRLALTDTGEKPFQKMQFLVRDWGFPREAAFGPLGGQRILDRRLKITEKQHPELQSLRKHIKSCFTQVQCFLMPYPGEKVSESQNFDGKLKDSRDKFKNSLRDLVPMLLAPENLILKKTNGDKIIASDLVFYLKAYIDYFNSDMSPKVEGILLVTAKLHTSKVVEAAKEFYKQCMTKICKEENSHLSSEELEAKHKEVKEVALEEFSTKRKMGGNELSAQYRKELENILDEEFERFMAENTSKANAAKVKIITIVAGTTLAIACTGGVGAAVGAAAVAGGGGAVAGIAGLAEVTGGIIGVTAAAATAATVLTNILDRARYSKLTKWRCALFS